MVLPSMVSLPMQPLCNQRKETVFMLAMLFYMVACLVVTAIFGWPYSWLDTGEQILIGYIIVQILCILLATVLPTMFMRKVVQVGGGWPTP